MNLGKTTLKKERWVTLICPFSRQPWHNVKSGSLKINQHSNLLLHRRKGVAHRSSMCFLVMSVWKLLSRLQYRMQTQRCQCTIGNGILFQVWIYQFRHGRQRYYSEKAKNGYSEERQPNFIHLPWYERWDKHEPERRRWCDRYSKHHIG